jgi:enoyl-CoA hydratase/carnithine racemase
MERTMERTMELKVTRYAVEDRVATVTLSRPAGRNAWTGRMEHELRWCMTAAGDDPDVRVVVLTGDPAGVNFCPGADGRALAKEAAAGAYDPGFDSSLVPYPGRGATEADFGHHLSYLLGLRVPVIAAVNGAAAGVGFALACFSDLRIVAEEAKLTTSFARLGMPAEHALSWLLPRMVGVTRAAELLLTARVVTGREAAAMGLANEARPTDEVLPRALELAHHMAHSLAPGSLAVIKTQLWADLRRSLHEAAAESEELLHAMVGRPEFVEGATAFLERRPPRF